MPTGWPKRSSLAGDVKEVRLGGIGSVLVEVLKDLHKT